ncbi:flavodoxin [Vibrio algicola]|uniref:Flavodoxin n=1 Tax=Vibrio algicola TaxID=2662262 RepID=A0A5Q0THS6_9VIBR|nr:flavodoxin [Vibrio algicola]
MESRVSQLIAQKIQWLSHHVDVAFPTPESLQGRELYLAAQATKTFTTQISSELLSQASQYPIWLDEVVLVDFHRLTIMFSILQAKAWSQQPEQEKLVIEFLTQIMLDDDYQLYMGFKQGEAVAALIVHKSVATTEDPSEYLLLSDVYLSSGYQVETALPFFASVIDLYQQPNDKKTIIVYPL